MASEENMLHFIRVSNIRLIFFNLFTTFIGTIKMSLIKTVLNEA